MFSGWNVFSSAGRIRPMGRIKWNCAQDGQFSWLGLMCRYSKSGACSTRIRESTAVNSPRSSIAMWLLIACLERRATRSDGRPAKQTAGRRGRRGRLPSAIKKRCDLNTLEIAELPKKRRHFSARPAPGRLGVGGSNPLAPTNFLRSADPATNPRNRQARRQPVHPTVVAGRCCSGATPDFSRPWYAEAWGIRPNYVRGTTPSAPCDRGGLPST
jgi:hypothetical protein